MFRTMILMLTVSVILSGCKEQERDPQQVEFEKKFEREAVLVRTCPGDPRFASGRTAVAVRVYRFQKELWYQDIDGYRRVDATPENVCTILTIPK